MWVFRWKTSRAANIVAGRLQMAGSATSEVLVPNVVLTLSTNNIPVWADCRYCQTVVGYMTVWYIDVLMYRCLLLVSCCNLLSRLPRECHTCPASTSSTVTWQLATACMHQFVNCSIPWTWHYCCSTCIDQSFSMYVQLFVLPSCLFVTSDILLWLLHWSEWYLTKRASKCVTCC